jgi:hypothetical protein
MLVRITGAIQIVLGLIIWFGIADAFIPIHILSGIILVLALWTLVFIAARQGVNLGFVAFAAVLGLLTVILGLVQVQLIPDQGHWIIQVIHLLVGLAVIGLAERLTSMIRKKQSPTMSG